MGFYQHAGLELAYDVVGDGFPLVLHTGAAGDSRMWVDAGYIAALTGFKAILLDHRGHGRSQAPPDSRGHTVSAYASDVVALADELRLERFAFWGYSNGACVGAELAASHPDRIAGLVLSGGIAGPEQRPEEERAAAETVRKEGIGGLLEGEDIPSWLRRQLVDETDAEVVAREIEGFADWNGWAVYPRILAPTLIVAGEYESEHVAAAAAALPSGRYAILSGADHIEAFVSSESVLSEVLPFLASVAA